MVALSAASSVAAVGAQEIENAGSGAIWVGLEHGSGAEAIMELELREVLRTQDVEPWILTRRVLVDETQLPHSHPTLTIHTRHVGDRLGLLATFVHEQLHWLEEEPWLFDFRAAMMDLEELFPEVPSPSNRGARDSTSTYRHLLICDLELQAMTALVGESAARKTLGDFEHYTWIYDKVLNDARVRDIALRYGFDVSQGVPDR
jgi:hypothetical protein